MDDPSAYEEIIMTRIKINVDGRDYSVQLYFAEYGRVKTVKGAVYVPTGSYLELDKPDKVTRLFREARSHNLLESVGTPVIGVRTKTGWDWPVAYVNIYCTNWKVVAKSYTRTLPNYDPEKLVAIKKIEDSSAWYVSKR